VEWVGFICHQIACRCNKWDSLPCKLGKLVWDAKRKCLEEGRVVIVGIEQV